MQEREATNKSFLLHSHSQEKKVMKKGTRGKELKRKEHTQSIINSSAGADAESGLNGKDTIFFVLAVVKGEFMVLKVSLL